MSRLKEIILGLEKPEDIDRVIPARAREDLVPLTAVAERALETMTKQLAEKGIVLSKARVKEPAAILLKLLQKKVRDINVLTDIIAASCYEPTIEECYHRFEQFLQHYPICGRVEDTLLRNGSSTYHALRFLVPSDGRVLQVRIKPEQYRAEDEGSQYDSYKMSGIERLQQWLREKRDSSIRLERVDEQIIKMWRQGRTRIEGRSGITLCQALDAYSSAPRNYDKVRCVRLSPASEPLVRKYRPTILEDHRRYRKLEAKDTSSKYVQQ